MPLIPLLGYDVLVDAGALSRLPEIVAKVSPNNRVALISDSNVAPIYGGRIADALGLGHRSLFTVPAGEQHKTRATWARLTDELLAAAFGRDTTIVALGGGVVGDLAGFVAATYMRGVPVVQVPTSLLAMVDASVGGKTGVDTPAGKNLVGAFHQPAAVAIDPAVLETLPSEHLRAGLAEILKHGVIADAAYFERVAAACSRGFLTSTGRMDELTDIIVRSVEIKAEVVRHDERESGLRKILNFGHTIGHAIEAATDFALLHGDAVAMGLVAEARIAEHLGIARRGTASVIEHACRSAGLPTALPDVPLDKLVALTHADKKVRAGRVEYALPIRIGEMANAEPGGRGAGAGAGAGGGWTVSVEDAVVREVLGGAGQPR